jgi:hypothetical protein
MVTGAKPGGRRTEEQVSPGAGRTNRHFNPQVSAGDLCGEKQKKKKKKQQKNHACNLGGFP